MGRFFNPDNSSFERAVNSKIYVDKTGLLEYTNSILNTEQSIVCNSRPRRFGKSVTANMLTAYYSKGCDSKQLFEKFDISKYIDFSEHLNKYNVIHLDVQWCLKNLNDCTKIVPNMQRMVVEEMQEFYPDLQIEDNEFLPDVMSRIYDKTGEKFIVIIDEWDTLIRDNTYNDDIQDEYIAFLSGMFKGSEPSKYIILAYLTGILRKHNLPLTISTNTQ